jgi:hypothetical protein
LFEPRASFITDPEPTSRSIDHACGPSVVEPDELAVAALDAQQTPITGSSLFFIPARFACVTPLSGRPSLSFAPSWHRSWCCGGLADPECFGRGCRP